MSGLSDSVFLTAPAWETLRKRTGVVIPAYLSPDIDRVRGGCLLRDTVAAYARQVDDPTHVCICVDGEQHGADLASKLGQELGVSVHVAPLNRGKLAAARNGMGVLLAGGGLEYVAVVDQDGDHFANELLNLVRAAQHIVGHTGQDRVLVIGRRSSRHRPMGFLRGELEEFADRVLMDALCYHSAICGQPLRLEYAFSLDEFPDVHSGYKLFSRSVAEQVFRTDPRLEGVSESCYYRHACEAVMTVEALLHGAYLGTVNRSTFNEQPITTFGRYNIAQLVADKIVWPCRRLDIPLPFVRQWMANHTPRLLLQTLAPMGQDEVRRITGLVLSTLGESSPEVSPPIQPIFV